MFDIHIYPQYLATGELSPNIASAGLIFTPSLIFVEIFLELFWHSVVEISVLLALKLLTFWENIWKALGKYFHVRS